MDWGQIYQETDTQTAFSAFHSVLLKVYNKHFPKQKIKLKYNSRKLWLTQGLKDAIKNKNKLYKRYMKCKTVANENTYKRYRNKLNIILKCAEKKHYTDLLNSNKDNIKKTCQIMKNIVNRNKTRKVHNKFKMGDGSIISDGTLISNKFNDFFTNIEPNLAKKIPYQDISHLDFMGPPLVNSIFLTHVTNAEICEILKSLKNGAAGHDEINAMSFNVVSSLITEPLTYVCNLSLAQGVFPDELKLANVLPLYKNDDPYAFSNYRPVSLSNVLSKVFEKVMYNRLIEFWETYKFFVNQQFGFRKLHSSFMALMMLMDKLITALENNEIVIGIFLDFSKAFDTVDHKILLSKLSHYDIRGVAHSWFTSYNGTSSATRNIICGVPQGSILGPLLFLIYINDLCDACKYTAPILFADDTNLFCNGSDLEALETNINQELAKISKWLKTNKLSFNVQKTHYMVFTKRRVGRFRLQLMIDGENIDEVEKTKFLGIIIDNKLNWKKHISYITGKVSRGVGMIIKARNYLNRDGLRCLYYSLVYPYFTYCNHIWGSTYKSNLRKLVVLQNKVLRIILHVKPRSSAEPLYKELDIMRFENINKNLIVNFMYRYICGLVPDTFSSFFIRNKDIHSHNTRTADHFHIPIVKTDICKTGIKYRGAVIWNILIKDGINVDVSEAVFKKFLRKLVNDGIIP